MRDLVTMDIEKGKILENRLLELSLVWNVSLVLGDRLWHVLTFSFEGLVSSKRIIIFPLYILAKYWLSIAAFA